MWDYPFLDYRKYKIHHILYPSGIDLVIYPYPKNTLRNALTLVSNISVQVHRQCHLWYSIRRSKEQLHMQSIRHARQRRINNKRYSLLSRVFTPVWPNVLVK